MNKVKIKDGVKVYNKSDKSHVRDFWLEQLRHTHMSYIGKNEKKILPRNKKYKEKYYVDD